MSRVSLRTRLASLIGLILVLCGSALLAISYGLVSSNLSAPLPDTLPSATHGIRGLPVATGTPDPRATAAVASKAATAVARKDASYVAARAATQSALRRRTLPQLVKQYLAVLVGIVLVAVALGWLLAGRLLRAVRRITSVAERVTGGNLDERIALEGPRDELRELADAFDGMLARLDSVFSAQRRFVADASHELRTPLAAMRAEVEVLASDPNATATDVEASTRVLRRQLARSMELIEALLALARSEPELLSCEAVDLASLAREALDNRAQDAAHRRLRIDAQLAPAVVEGDQRLLALLVANLLDNATKHNHDGGWIGVHTGVDRNRGLLTIANTGPLVTPEETRELTQAFRRGGEARVGDGHGLGLAIVAAVADAHRGAITIGPRAEGGLQVEVGIPLAADTAASTLPALNASGTLADGATVGVNSV